MKRFLAGLLLGAAASGITYAITAGAAVVVGDRTSRRLPGVVRQGPPRPPPRLTTAHQPEGHHPMTDRPYTDTDLYAEAARQHKTLTENPDFMGVGEQMTNSGIPSRAEWSSQKWWHSLNEDHFELAQNHITDLIIGAADVSAWAVQLGAAGLTPHEPIAVHSTTGGWEAAVQIATASDLTDEARTELLAEVQEAVTATVCRVLGLKPVQ